MPSSVDSYSGPCERRLEVSFPRHRRGTASPTGESLESEAVCGQTRNQKMWRRKNAARKRGYYELSFIIDRFSQKSRAASSRLDRNGKHSGQLQTITWRQCPAPVKRQRGDLSLASSRRFFFYFNYYLLIPVVAPFCLQPDAVS